MSINFNDTTPAAPGGGANVKWQVDGSNNVSAYVPSDVAGVDEADITLTDVTTDNVTSSAHGFAPKSPADATKFLNGAATPVYANPKDSDLAVSDITTNNVSISAHGFAPKAPNDATKFLDGTGAYSVPPGTSHGIPAAGTTGQRLAKNSGTDYDASWFSDPYDLVVSLVGMPASGATVYLFTATRAISFEGNFAGSYGSVGTDPSATATYTVKKNGSSIGTIVVSTGGVVTFTTTSGAAQSLAAGDRLTITAPAPQDVTLADAAFTLAGTR